MEHQWYPWKEGGEDGQLGGGGVEKNCDEEKLHLLFLFLSLDAQIDPTNNAAGSPRHRVRISRQIREEIPKQDIK